MKTSPVEIAGMIAFIVALLAIPFALKATENVDFWGAAHKGATPEDFPQN